MPMTPDLRRGVDRIRDYLFGGGYPNPAQNAEQLSFLIYFYMYEAADAVRVRAARRPGVDRYESAFDGNWRLRNPRNAPEEGNETVPRELMRWSSWAHALNGGRLVNWVREEVFPFHAELARNGATDFMDGARLVIDEPTVLTQVVSQLNDLHLDRVDADTKGDLFEHVLRQIRQAGELGQFRTPRHVIRAVVQLVDPHVGETVYDPAAGTAGFLVAAWDHIRLANSSPDGIEEVEAEGKTLRRGLGDGIEPGRSAQAAQGDVLRRRRGPTDGEARDDEPDPAWAGPGARAATRCIDSLAGPGGEGGTRHASARVRRDSRQSALLRSARPRPNRRGRESRPHGTDGTPVLAVHAEPAEGRRRCGVVVPEGVLFGSTGAHRELRRKLVENNTVEAVLSLPGGVFNPYSGVKTSVLVFRKGGATKRVMFLHADNDGFKLDANHDQPIEEDDLPGLVAAYRNRDEREREWRNRDLEADWTEKWWFAETEAIREADFNLSAGRIGRRPALRLSIATRGDSG